MWCTNSYTHLKVWICPAIISSSGDSFNKSISLTTLASLPQLHILYHIKYTMQLNNSHKNMHKFIITVCHFSCVYKINNVLILGLERLHTLQYFSYFISAVFDV